MILLSNVKFANMAREVGLEEATGLRETVALILCCNMTV